jgi:hypothetical protein
MRGKPKKIGMGLWCQTANAAAVIAPHCTTPPLSWNPFLLRVAMRYTHPNPDFITHINDVEEEESTVGRMGIVPLSEQGQLHK